MKKAKNLNEGIDNFLEKLGSTDDVDVGMPDMLANILESTDGEKLGAIGGYFESLMPHMKEFAQGKSNYQIEKFIAQEVPTPAATFAHLLHQIRALIPELMKDAIRIIELRRTNEYLWGKDGDEDVEKKRSEPKMWSDGQGGEKLRWYDIDLAEVTLNIQNESLSMMDKMYQVQCFCGLLARLEKTNGKKFTRQQYIDEEPEYWDTRLMRQAIDQLLNHKTGIAAGQISSMRIASSPSTITDGYTSDIFAFVADVARGKIDASQLNQINRDVMERSGTIFGNSAGADEALKNFDVIPLIGSEKKESFGTSITERLTKARA